MEVMDKIGLMSRVEGALDSVRAFLQADGGDVELLDIEQNMTVKIRLLGQCRSCNLVGMTMKAGIEDAIKKAVPQIQQVIAE
jgi:Fe-S cluster biogenesis protein NfuA